MRESSSKPPIENRADALMKPTGTWRKWILIIAMVSWIYVASSLLRYTASATVNYILVGGIIGFTVVLIGLSFAREQLFTFAAGLIFLGTLLSSISPLHAGSFRFPPDHWKIAVVLAGGAALSLSPWIKRTVEHLSFVDRPESLDEEAEPRCEFDPRDEDVEILIRLDSRGVELFPKARCIVTIQYPRKCACNTPAHGNTSERGGQHTGLHDHKLPFWVECRRRMGLLGCNDRRGRV
jgi:hypothetical protein